MPEPAFFCENCKREVSSKDKICPYCGRFFTDVRCPRCNYSGAATKFHSGCPRCGYLNPAWSTQSATPLIKVLSPSIFDTTSPHRPPKKKHLPWYFLSVTIALGTICAALLYLFIS
jgi:hypothetical protein